MSRGLRQYTYLANLSNSKYTPSLALLSILVGAGHGDAISAKGQPNRKVCHPRNPCIAEQFIECDSTGHEGAEVVFLSVERKALTGHQGFSQGVLADGFEWRRIRDVALQDLQEQAFRPGELCDWPAGEWLAA